VNFYLLADWPLEYQDDPQSRFVNERKHANIQKDGTFSVVPRMWGGITTPNELRAIADAADEYNVPTVKVTGGQRIDLLGVKGKDLPFMWVGRIGLEQRLFQGVPNREDLCGDRSLPVWDAGFDRAWDQARVGALGVLDAA